MGKMSMVKMEELERKLIVFNTNSVDRLDELEAKIEGLNNEIRNLEFKLVSDLSQPARPKIHISKLFGKFVGVSDESVNEAKENYKIIRRKLSDNGKKSSFQVDKYDYIFIYHPIMETHDLEF